jgi:hypothetical protein
MATSRQRADRLVERLFRKAPPAPQLQEEPAKPQSVADRLKGIHESRVRTLAIMRRMKRF